ncbi:MAG: hypothetical protein ACI4M6_02465 [Christensenellaceae bacterium]
MIDFFIFFSLTLIIFAFGFCTKTAKSSSLWLLALLGVLTYRFYSIQAFLLSAVMLIIVYALKFACKIIIKRKNGLQNCEDSLDKTFSLTATLFIEIMFLVVLKFNFKGLEFNFSYFKFAFLASLTTAFAVGCQPYVAYIIAPLLKKANGLKDGKFIFGVTITALLSLICGTATFAVTKTFLYSLLISLSSILSCFAVAYFKDYLDNKKARTARTETTETAQPSTAETAETAAQLSENGEFPESGENTAVPEALQAVGTDDGESAAKVADDGAESQKQPNAQVVELENTSEAYRIATTFLTMTVAIILALIIKY